MALRLTDLGEKLIQRAVKRREALEAAARAARADSVKPTSKVERGRRDKKRKQQDLSRRRNRRKKK